MWIWILIALVVVAAGVYGFWPRAGGLDGRINRAGSISQSNTEGYGASSTEGGPL